MCCFIASGSISQSIGTAMPVSDGHSGCECPRTDSQCGKQEASLRAEGAAKRRPRQRRVVDGTLEETDASRGKKDPGRGGLVGGERRSGRQGETAGRTRIAWK